MVSGEGDVAVNLAADVALEAADGLAAGLSFGDAASDVVLGSFVPTQAGDGDRVERGVGPVCFRLG